MKSIRKDRLLGTWEIDPEDHRAIEVYGNVTIEFNSIGRLRYIVHTEEKEQIMLMTYKVDGDRLITEQPSAPRPSGVYEALLRPFQLQRSKTPCSQAER